MILLYNDRLISHRKAVPNAKANIALRGMLDENLPVLYCFTLPVMNEQLVRELQAGWHIHALRILPWKTTRCHEEQRMNRQILTKKKYSLTTPVSTQNYKTQYSMSTGFFRSLHIIVG